MPRYHVLSIGDAYDFGAATATAYTVVTARDPLRVHATPGTNTPSIGLLARGSTVEGTGKTAQADGQTFAEVLHPTLNKYGWADLRYLATVGNTAEQLAKQNEADSAQIVADAAAGGQPAPLAQGAKPAGLTPAQLSVSASVGGWTILAIVAAVGAVWYVSRDKR